MTQVKDYIDESAASDLYGLFCERVKRSPEKTAYHYFDKISVQWENCTWSDMAKEVSRWQQALAKEGYQPGDRVAVMLRNCREWVMFDQAALSLGLVVVPLFVEDRPENVAYILENSGAKFLLLEGDIHWKRMCSVLHTLKGITRVLTLEEISHTPVEDDRLLSAGEWLAEKSTELLQVTIEPDTLATIVYTSGTTGRPKGVMLTHRNIMFDAQHGLMCIDVYPDDTMLSFLPLSHMLERAAGYYIAIVAGCAVAYARSVQDLAEDLLTVKPTVMISVPRIYERVYNKIYEQLELKPPFAQKLFRKAVATGWASFEHKQGRAGWTPSLLLNPLLHKLVGSKVMAKLGGRLRFAICGGAALGEDVAKTFIGLGLNLTQGYGLTEHAPVIAVNKIDDNDPASVGEPLPGVEVRISNEGELQVRSPAVMPGYWKNEEATKELIDEEGWLATGDKVSIRDKKIYITGRIKEIIVMSNGEKMPPADMEMAIMMDPLFEQVMLHGEGKAFLCLLATLNPDVWREVASHNDMPAVLNDAIDNSKFEKLILNRIADKITEFPAYAKVRRVIVCREPWTIDEGLMTPTLKIRRKQILEKYTNQVDELYKK
ncbi:MAG TPA: long-chain fatty acid--CoA ligase [Gammaproteobacteria bacterium]|nr:long-chain fatty acid--CoA ligase [Gammaproteobacteria bacterium]